MDTFNAYPHLLHQKLKARFPFAVINVIVSAIGGETSIQGAQRFAEEVLPYRPDVLLIDYNLNDRHSGLEAAAQAWRSMIEAALAASSKVILLTPTWDNSGLANPDEPYWQSLKEHAAQARALAAEYGVGLCDSYASFEKHIERGGEATDLLSWSNHPNRLGHELVADQLMQWFAYY